VRSRHDAFHLAIPVGDLDQAYDFYVKGLGCKPARRYDDRITLDFFGDQLVCHLSERWDRSPDLYPRHFGVTFVARDDFDRLVKLAHMRSLDIYRDTEHRFEGQVEEHLTFVLRDPSNNLLEFKHYFDPRMIY
jgi:extradiol dioxygenase family protein